MDRQKKVSGNLKEKRLGERMGGNVQEKRKKQETSKIFTPTHAVQGKENRDKPHVLYGGVCQYALEVGLANHEHGADGDGENSER